MTGRGTIPGKRQRLARCVAILCGLVAALGLASAVAAHEVRPAYLELREERPGEFDVLFKVPMRGDLRLSLAPSFSGELEALAPVTTRTTGDAAVQTWRLRSRDPLRGQTVRVGGLEATMTDALVRIVFLDGFAWTYRLTPQQPEAVIPPRQSAWAVAGQYTTLGIEHILLGIDHLLFVLALLLLARGAWLLVKTITAFTVAHSITLALAVLGYVHVPAPPVEALIALSIMFVAVEAVHLHRGRESLTTRMPWIVAFTFGLLHGLGFAGALSEVGLPAGQVPTALLFFNIGVEIGQLAFVAAVLGAVFLTERIRLARPRWASLAAPYAIGSVATFWVFERVAAF